MRQFRIYLIILYLIIFIETSCTKREYGEKIKIKNFTTIETIKRNPGNFLNSIVKLKGKVVEESSRGLWITLQDKFFIIHINFEKQNFSLPTMLSNKVEVIGRVVQSKDGYFIAGKWIKINN